MRTNENRNNKNEQGNDIVEVEETDNTNAAENKKDKPCIDKKP